MGSGFDGLSLGLFTTLAPAGVIAFVALALVRLSTSNAKAAGRIDRMVALPFAVCLIGFIASATHLGTPANALHVFAGAGRSPLSNEVLAAVVFLFLLGSYWMFAFRRHFPLTLARLWLVVTCLAGIALVACTANAYLVSTVITWNTLFTPANLWFSALLAGPLLGLLFIELAQVWQPRFEVALFALSALALLAGTFVLILHEQSLSHVANNETLASSLAPEYGGIIALHALLGVAGLACSFFSLSRTISARRRLILRVIASGLALLAVFATRLVFYQLHLTVGF